MVPGGTPCSISSNNGFGNSVPANLPRAKADNQPDGQIDNNRHHDNSTPLCVYRRATGEPACAGEADVYVVGLGDAKRQGINAS